MNGKSLKMRIKRMLAFACAWIMFMQSFLMPVTSVEITNPSDGQQEEKYQVAVTLSEVGHASDIEVEVTLSNNTVIELTADGDSNTYVGEIVSANMVPQKGKVVITGTNLKRYEDYCDFAPNYNTKMLGATIDVSNYVLYEVQGTVSLYNGGNDEEEVKETSVAVWESNQSEDEEALAEVNVGNEGTYSFFLTKGCYKIACEKTGYVTERKTINVPKQILGNDIELRKQCTLTVNANEEVDGITRGKVSLEFDREPVSEDNGNYVVAEGTTITITAEPKDFYEVSGSSMTEMVLADEEKGIYTKKIVSINSTQSVNVDFQPISCVTVSGNGGRLKISRQMMGGTVEKVDGKQKRIRIKPDQRCYAKYSKTELKQISEEVYELIGDFATISFAEDLNDPQLKILNEDIISIIDAGQTRYEWYINGQSKLWVRATDKESGIYKVYAKLSRDKALEKDKEPHIYWKDFVKEDLPNEAFGEEIPICAEDKVGRVSENTITVYYDEEPPKVTSVSVNTVANCTQDGILCYTGQDLKVSLGVSENTLIKKIDYVITSRMLEAGVPDEAVAGIFYGNAPSGSEEFPQGHDPKQDVVMTVPMNSDLPSGKYYLYFAATDMAGNRQTEKPVCVPIIIDRSKPEVTAITGKQEEISGENNWYKADDEFVFHAIISDNHTWSGLKGRYQLVKAGEMPNYENAEIISENDSREIETEGKTGGAYEVTMTPNKPQQDGTYILYVWAQDGCANCSEPSVYMLHYDTRTPQVGMFSFDVKEDLRGNTLTDIFTKFGNFFRLNKQPTPQTVKIRFCAEDMADGNNYTQEPQIQKLTLWYLTEEDYEAAETATMSDSTVEIPGSMPPSAKKVTEFIKGAGGVYETEIKGLENNRFYRILIEAEDNAGNIAYTVPTENELYKSNLVMIDQTNPGIVLAPTKEFETPDYVQNKNGVTKKWYSAKKKVAFRANGEDKASGIFSMSMWVNGNTAKGSEKKLVERMTTGYVMEADVSQGDIEADGKYVFHAQIMDNAGNIAEADKTIYVDEDAPKISKVEFASGAVDEMEVVPMQYGFFFKKKTVVTVEATDYIGKSKKEASGVKTITYYLEDEDKKTTEEITVAAKAGAKNTYTTSFTVPAGFKGQIYVKATDNVGQSSTFVYPKGTVIDSAQEHKKHSYAKIVMEQTPYRDENNNPLYNKLPSIQLRTKDTKSGIAKNTWQVKAPQEAEPEGKGTLTVNSKYDEKTDKFITTFEGDEGWKTPEKLDLNLVTRADKTYQVKSERNAVEARLKLTDHAGNSEKATKKVFSVDMTAPQVTVEYDNNDVYNEKYYKKERYATIKVIDANFSEEKCEIRVEGPAVTKSDWEHAPGAGCNGNIHTKDCTYTCVVGFVDDGEYTFGFTCTDRAGWKGSYDQTDEFIIDMTEPLIRVDYDNDDVRNGHYYKETRTATVQIEEHNFEADDVVITMTASDKGSPLAVPQISGWSHNEDFHTATIAYDYDGEFTFDIEYTDLADNDAAEYEQDHFIIDTTEPELEITGVKNYSANKGKVEPVVSGKDKYMEDMAVTLKGSLSGSRTPEYKKTRTGDTTTYAFEDTGYKKENDDIYTLHVTASDMAGNEVEEEIVYSVNRFGSVYEYDENTKKLIEDYYTSKVKDLVIREVNVNSLKVRRITYSKDGEIVTLREGSDYSLQEKGSKDTWKEYIYTIHGETFEEEGKYTLTLYSEDEAENRSDNKVKGKEIEFVVDRTAPDFVLSGIEDGGRYREESREFIVNVADNMGVSKLEIYNDGKLLASFDSEEILEKNGTLSVPLQGKNDWQSIKVVTYDMAGNRSESAPVSYLITTNVFVQWYKNKWAVMGTTVLILLLAGGTAAIWAGKKKKAAAK